MLVFLFTFTACGNSEATADTVSVHETEVTQTEATVTETTVETTEASQLLETYYDRNEIVNLYLNRFNAANPDQLIDSNLFEVYFHHGSEHDEQIIFARDDFEVVITGSTWGNGLKVVIDGSKQKNNEEYKVIFMQYARAYSQDLTDEKLDEYWQTILDDTINTVDFGVFECSLQIFNDAIEYMTIDGKIE